MSSSVFILRVAGGEVLVADLRGPTCSVKDLVAPHLPPRERYVVSDWRLALAIMRAFEDVEVCSPNARPPVLRCGEEPNVTMEELAHAYAEGVGSRVAALGYEFDVFVAPSYTGAMLRGVYARLAPLGIEVVAVKGYTAEPADRVVDPYRHVGAARMLLEARGLLVGRSTIDAVAAAVELVKSGDAVRAIAPILSGPCMD